MTILINFHAFQMFTGGEWLSAALIPPSAVWSGLSPRVQRRRRWQSQGESQEGLVDYKLSSSCFEGSDPGWTHIFTLRLQSWGVGGWEVARKMLIIQRQRGSASIPASELPSLVYCSTELRIYRRGVDNKPWDHFRFRRQGIQACFVAEDGLWRGRKHSSWLQAVL